MSKKRKTPPLPIPTPTFSHDLVVLVSDSQMKQLVGTLLTKRTPALGCQAVTYDLAVHPEKDTGCVNRPDGILASFRNTHRHALVLFDREGCGQEDKSRVELETAVEKLLSKTWADRARAVVIDPELENWVWMRSMHVPAALGWNDPDRTVFEWLVEQERLEGVDQPKPERPKEAVEAVLRHVRKPRSGAIYAAIAEKASMTHCIDPAFQKFRDTLREWFPLPSRG